MSLLSSASGRNKDRLTVFRSRRVRASGNPLGHCFPIHEEGGFEGTNSSPLVQNRVVQNRLVQNRFVQYVMCTSTVADDRADAHVEFDRYRAGAWLLWLLGAPAASRSHGPSTAVSFEDSGLALRGLFLKCSCLRYFCLQCVLASCCRPRHWANQPAIEANNYVNCVRRETESPSQPPRVAGRRYFGRCVIGRCPIESRRNGPSNQPYSGRRLVAPVRAARRAPRAGRVCACGQEICQWQTKCSSMRPTRRRPGWSFYAAIVSKNSTSNPPIVNNFAVISILPK